MNSGRNLYVVVTVIAAVGLFGAGLAAWRSYGSEEGGAPAGYIQSLGLVVPVGCVIGAMGVIWLGWRLLRLRRGVTSVAAWLRDGKLGSIRGMGLQPVKTRPGPPTGDFGGLRGWACHDTAVDCLVEAVNSAFERYGSEAGEMEKHLKDSQIQIQLSQRQQKNTEAIIYSIRDAVIVVDEFDKLLMANEAAGRLLDFDYRNSTHKPIDELAGAEHSEFVDFLTSSKKNKARATKREIEFERDGVQRIFDCVVSCVFDVRGEICGAAAVLHDITREKEVSQMKNDFVSHVSHELKTPLASITAYSEMLADGEADDEETRKEFYSVIQNQAKRLNRLIEDILNISRIESGLIKVSKEPASLTMLIEEQLQMIKSYAEEKSIEVSGQKPIVFDQVMVDKDMMSQVIVNLLSNAVKYTPAGGSVRIETEVDEISRLARITITDTGVGIPEDEVEHVFEKFYRVGANKKQAKGTGLGLNLVKQIVETVHGGRVFVTSKVGEGSRFGFELPLAKGEPAAVR